MQLKGISVKNFKQVRNVDFELADINILVGTNGSGKSSIVQAAHLACCVMRQAERVDSKTSTVGVEEMDYLPTNDYKTLGHGHSWGNKEGTPASEVALRFEKDDLTAVIARCKLRSARNAGISISGSVPAELSDLLRKRQQFFSAYIPGVSGIPNKEEKRSRKVVLKACSFGDSNVYLRNVLLLLKQIDQQNIRQIESWIERILGPMAISVNHDESRDLYIRCSVTINGIAKPIELAGTGYLQLIQIFCYILLFNPHLLLIDEPDIHLHPDVQEKLVRTLALVAKARGTKVLITTHSPFVVRGAPMDAKVVWLNNGVVESDDRHLVEIALGWGAFGKRVIFVSEDSGTTLIRNIVSQWPEIERYVAFYPGSGFKNLPSPKQAKDLFEALGGRFKVLIHRDRDSMTDDEVARLRQSYNAEGVELWCPAQSDIEAYFCDAGFIRQLLQISQAEAEKYINDALTSLTAQAKSQFEGQRGAHNQEFYAGGGSPPNDEVWPKLLARPLRGTKGKTVFRTLKGRLPGKAFSEVGLESCALDGTIAPDLRAYLQNILA